MNFGPKKRSFYYSSNPEDYVHGKIYRTTTAYLAKFKKQVPPIFPSSEDIAVELGTIEGLWPEEIRIDGKEAFSFLKMLPYEI